MGEIMRCSVRHLKLLLVAFVFWLGGGWLHELPRAAAQQQQPLQTTIQLPSVNFFSINTVVSVPDAGVARLGGVSRSGYGSSSYGVPGLGNLPLVNRPFRNQAIGGFGSANQSSVRVQIISNREISDDLLAEAERRDLTRQSVDPNGSPTVRRQADFISRNVGRRR